MSTGAQQPRTDGRWRRRKQARPGEIVAAALDVFVERGYSAARLEDVARRAGVTKGTLYLYFPSKEALFEEVVRSAILPNIAQAEALARNTAIPAAAVLGRIVRMLGMTLATSAVGAIPKLVLAEAANFPEMARFYLREVIQRGFRLIEAVLRRGIEAGEFRAVDAAVTARLVVAPAVFLAIWRTSFAPHDDRPFDPAGMLDRHVDLLLRGLEARP